MFKPHVPVNPTPTGEIIPVITTLGTGHPAHSPAVQAHAPVCGCHHAPAPPPARTLAGLTPGAAIAFGATATVGVLVIGVVLVSMVLALAITAGSLAIVALALRSALAQPPSTRR